MPQPLAPNDRLRNELGSCALADLFAGLVAVTNAFSVYAAITWSMTTWRDNQQQRGHWSYFPLVWLIGSAALLAAQMILSVIPTLFVTSPRRSPLPRSIRMLVLLAGLAGPAVTIGGFLVICWYNHVTPTVHHPGM